LSAPKVLWVEAAGSAVSGIISAGIIPAGMEMMDKFSINAVEDVVQTQCYPRDAEAILLVEIDGSALEVATNQARVAEICRQNGARNVTMATEPEQRLRLWKGRKAAFAAMGKIRPNYYVQDGVIPRTQLSYVLEQIAILGDKYGYDVANVFHAGDGNLHPLVLYDNSVAGALEQVEALGGEILKLCVKVGGSISGEHGIGADKRCYIRRQILRRCSGCVKCLIPRSLLIQERFYPRRVLVVSRQIRRISL
jgi:glycolate oxidase